MDFHDNFCLFFCIYPIDSVKEVNGSIIPALDWLQKQDLKESGIVQPAELYHNVNNEIIHCQIFQKPVGGYSNGTLSFPIIFYISLKPKLACYCIM